MTARTPESQVAFKQQLDIARRRSDESIADLYDWPGSESEGQMFKSMLLFNAVMQRHREDVRVGTYFWDEMQFYTNVIDVLYGWLHRHIELRGDTSDAWKWVLSYSYLMGGVNYVGAEQALCSVFHSIICFSHRETFFYANFSFSGEAVFRLYRQSYPEDRGDGWRTRSHSDFFPQLVTCREEIFADMDYLGMSIDPSLCDYSRKNESRIQELDYLIIGEHNLILEALQTRLTTCRDDAIFNFLFSGIVFGAAVCYVVILQIIRCTCIKCTQMRKTRKWRLKEIETAAAADDKFDCGDHIALNANSNTQMAAFAHQTTTFSTSTFDTFGTTSTLGSTKILRYEDYNCKPPHIKVATV